MFGLDFVSNEEQHGELTTPSPSSSPAAWEAYKAQQLKTQQEPVNRQMAVEKVQAPETAKAMRYIFESGNILDLHDVHKTVPILGLEQPLTGSGVYENTPIRLEGVIRSDEAVNAEEEQLMCGSTKNKLDDWVEKSKSEFVIKRRAVQVAEDEGKILENEPIQRNDVIRETDQFEFTNGLPNEGNAALLRHQWANMKEDFVKDERPIKLVEREDEQRIYENEPKTRTDVLREEDHVADEGLRSGMTNDMKSYWVNYKDKEIYARDRPIDIPAPGIEVKVLENEPIRLEGVVREEDTTREEIAAIETGKAKTLVNRWSSIDDSFQRKNKFDIEKELASGKEAGVFENQPGQLKDGVIKCDEVVQEVLANEGVTKTMSQRFHDTDFWNPKIRKDAPTLELAEGPGVHENQPATLGPEVIRCNVDSDQILSDIRQQHQGITANLVGKWVRNDVQGADLAMPDKSYFHEPSKLLEKERAKDAGIYENTPNVRTDVYREEDYQPEMIPASKTKNLREIWMKMGEETPKKTGLPQVRFTPPRERTPPSVNDSEFTSVQHINLNQ